MWWCKAVCVCAPAHSCLQSAETCSSLQNQSTSAPSVGLSQQPAFDKDPLLVNLKLNDHICVWPHKLQVHTPVCPVSRPHQWSHAILIHHVDILEEEKHMLRKV